MQACETKIRGRGKRDERRVFAHEPGDEHADLAGFLAGAPSPVAARGAIV